MGERQATEFLHEAMDIDAPSSDRVNRVHLVHQSFGDYVSGLVHGLHDIGLSVVVTTVSSGSARLTAPDVPDGVEHHQVSLPRFRHPMSPIGAARAVREILQVPADVVHWQAVGSPWVDLAYLAQMGKRPNVVTIHDMQPHPGDGTVLPLAFTAVHRLARRADQVTVHAPHIKTQAEAIGVDPGRVSVIAHGELATRYLPPERLPLAAPAPDPASDPTSNPASDPASNPASGPASNPAASPSVLFFGRAQGYKGLDVLIEAMRLVNRHGDRVDLVVAGSGPTIDELLPPDRPTPTWCRVIQGHVAREDVADLFGAATMVALPYREASQSGVAALAAGFGRPVVASRVPGLADIVIDGESGLLVEPSRPGELADAIVRLADDRALADQLAAGAHRHATGALSWTEIANQLHTVYDRAATYDRILG